MIQIKHYIILSIKYIGELKKMFRHIDMKPQKYEYK